jgi:serine/threonine protein kinase
VIELSTRVFEVLRKDDEFILYRGRSKADVSQAASASHLSQATARPIPSEMQGAGCGHDPASAGRSQVLVLSPALAYPRPESLKRLEHEYSLREELDATWAARPIEITRHWDRQVLVLEDPGGVPLDRLLGRALDLGSFLRVAISLATAIGQLHQRGLIHKDIKPANVLVDSVASDVWLIGFGNASRRRSERRSTDPPGFIAGTLAYMAPEQTGRMNRSIDSRSDLYSLGVTLYEVLTGSLPFTASDPIGWVHCHIAREPTPPSRRLNNLPTSISAIIMKLLAKTAEETLPDRGRSGVRPQKVSRRVGIARTGRPVPPRCA